MPIGQVLMKMYYCVHLSIWLQIQFMFQNIGPFSHPPKQALLPINGTLMPFDDILSRKNFDEKKRNKINVPKILSIVKPWILDVCKLL